VLLCGGGEGGSGKSTKNRRLIVYERYPVTYKINNRFLILWRPGNTGHKHRSPGNDNCECVGVIFDALITVIVKKAKGTSLSDFKQPALDPDTSQAKTCSKWPSNPQPYTLDQPLDQPGRLRYPSQTGSVWKLFNTWPCGRRQSFKT